MENKLIYIADDELNIRNIIQSFLKKEGYDVETFYNGADLYKAFERQKADLLIVDIMMPKLDGYTLCERIREISHVPIVFVSAKDTEKDKIEGFKLGADDYLTKPFSPMELVMRVNGIFRRITLSKGYKPEKILDYIDISINPFAKTALCNGHNIGLSIMEFSFLYYLIENKARAVSRKELLDKIWGFESHVDTRAPDDLVKRIRKKLQESDAKLKIETVWGFGFRIKNEA